MTTLRPNHRHQAIYFGRNHFRLLPTQSLHCRFSSYDVRHRQEIRLPQGVPVRAYHFPIHAGAVGEDPLHFSNFPSASASFLIALSKFHFILAVSGPKV
ncbi:hypothetical protein BC936DRAFT_136860 [Jimgerdemannia flammicorona]|uniref:Uncharacterized protein n=1 Tax=Jimgerdemannia flammicorona TaxID=994334 RepID=A0A433DNF1_9FUNG|nr:hypothetical protein BC936DRAFT_136860 [Jimgerdemannia flammicorona]